MEPLNNFKWRSTYRLSNPVLFASKTYARALVLVVFALFAVTAAASDGEIPISDFTDHWAGPLCLLIFAHLKWSWAIMVVCFASIAANFYINSAAFA